MGNECRQPGGRAVERLPPYVRCCSAFSGMYGMYCGKKTCDVLKKEKLMKYTFCEKMMWFAMTPTMFRWLKQQRPDWDAAKLKRMSKWTYRKMIDRTPDIGALSKNPLRMCLSGGAVWLSVYESADGKMDETLFQGLVTAGMESPLIRSSFKKKQVFTHPAQEKMVAVAKVSNQISDSPFNWKREVIPGRDADEYTINYHQCGLCALGRQENLFHLVKYLCVLDTLSVDWMGGVLYRNHTIAIGGACCDFYICRKGSRWERERQKR